MSNFIAVTCILIDISCKTLALVLLNKKGKFRFLSGKSQGNSGNFETAGAWEP